MSGTDPARAPRLLGLACLALVAAAALLWGASAAPWYVVTPEGRSPVTFTGAEAQPSLTGWALLALAGVAGAVAAGGILRRAVGVLLVVAGGWQAVIAVLALAANPFATGTGLPRSPASTPVDVAGLVGGPVETHPSALLAVAGGLLLAAAGAVLVLAEPRLPRLGAAYAAPGARRPPADPDRAAWTALDEGRDPTADPAGGTDGDSGTGTGAAAGTGVDQPGGSTAADQGRGTGS